MKISNASAKEPSREFVRHSKKVEERAMYRNLSLYIALCTPYSFSPKTFFSTATMKSKSLSVQDNGGLNAKMLLKSATLSPFRPTMRQFALQSPMIFSIYQKSIQILIAVPNINTAKIPCNAFVFIFCPAFAPKGAARMLATIMTAAGP